MTTPKNAYLDYIRLASWHDGEALQMMADVRRATDKWRPARWLQYKGYAAEHLFYGTGEQGGRRHYVFRQSGPDSSWLSELGMEHQELYCTRLDLQRTIKEPPEYDARDLYERLLELDRRSEVSIIQSATGSTIYLGNRTSAKFIRIYQKQLEHSVPGTKGDKSKFLRFEFEFKKDVAKGIFSALRKGERRNSVFDHYLARSELTEDLLSWFRRGGETGDASRLYSVQKQVVDHEKKMAWLGSLEKTVIAMGYDHYSGPFVKHLLEDWLEVIDRAES